MDPGLDAELGGACLRCFPHPVRELLLRMLIGVGRAPRLAKAAERAPDHAHIGDVDVRLATNVTVSPARRARSSSAALRISSITAGRRSANSAVSSSPVRRCPSRARSTARGTTSSATRGTVRRPLPRLGMNDQ